MAASRSSVGEHQADVCEFLGVSLGALMVAVVLQTWQSRRP